jgi:hypothetical protein
MKKGSVLASMALLTRSTEEYGIYTNVPAELKSFRNPTMKYNATYQRRFQ